MFLKNSDPLINWNFEACNFFTPLLQLLCYKVNIQAAPSARNKIIHTHPKIKNVCVRTCVCVCAKRACVCMPVCVCVCVCVCVHVYVWERARVVQCRDQSRAYPFTGAHYLHPWDISNISSREILHYMGQQRAMEKNKYP